MNYRGDFIHGKFIKVDKPDGSFKDISPADLKDVIMKVPYCADHVDKACEDAKKAFPKWARLSLEDRKYYLNKLKHVFETDKHEISEAISRDTGKPLWEAMTEVSALVNKIDITLNHSLNRVQDQHISNALPGVSGVVRYKPRGVMAVIGPFNFPAHLPNGHIIPALVMGNTVVFKPSEQTPYVGQIYARCFEKAEFPTGVFNMVQGNGEIGRRLAIHEAINGVLFTGSYEVGVRIKQETLHHYWKILALEMGGKNATVVWDDADLDKAIYETLIGSFLTAGQRCSCTSRVLLHEKIYTSFLDRFYEAAKKLSIGHWSENVFMGPLINDSAVEKYLRFQEIANRENCESMMRGKVLDLKHKGHYVTPSIHLVQKFDPKSVYQKSEIFGPNVAIYKVSEYEEAMDIVNATGYGLVLSFFSQTRSLYEQSILDAKVGLINWNRTTNGASSRLPFGGIGKSGNDRPSADFAIDYCAVPVASLEDSHPFDGTKILPGVRL